MKLPNWSFTVIIYAALVVPPVLTWLIPDYFIPIWGSGVLVSLLLFSGEALWSGRVVLEKKKEPEGQESGQGCFSKVLLSCLFSWFAVYAVVSGWVEVRRIRRRVQEAEREQGRGAEQESRRD